MKKLCSACKKKKKIEAFSKDMSRNDGVEYVCKLCRKKWGRKYYKTNKYRTTNRSKQKRYQLRNPDKSIARRKARKTLLGKHKCEKCGKKAEMHHPDYSKPLDVIWLCRKHHLEIHYKTHQESEMI